MVFFIKIENRLILVDAGCEMIPGFDMAELIRPVKVLPHPGISPDEITDAMIAHAYCHIECVKYF